MRQVAFFLLLVFLTLQLAVAETAADGGMPAAVAVIQQDRVSDCSTAAAADGLTPGTGCGIAEACGLCGGCQSCHLVGMTNDLAAPRLARSGRHGFPALATGFASPPAFEDIKPPIG